MLVVEVVENVLLQVAQTQRVLVALEAAALAVHLPQELRVQPTQAAVVVAQEVVLRLQEALAAQASSLFPTQAQHNYSVVE